MSTDWARKFRRIPYAEQADDLDCGVTCLRMALKFFGREVSRTELQRLAPTGRRGISATALIDAARACDLRATAQYAGAGEFGALPRAAILHCRAGHYVVFDRVDRDGRARILDPMLGRRHVAVADCAAIFTDIAIVLEPSPTCTTDGWWSRSIAPIASELRAAGSPATIVASALLWAVARLLAIALAAAIVTWGATRNLNAVVAGALAGAPLVACEMLRVAWLRRRAAAARLAIAEREIANAFDQSFEAVAQRGAMRLAGDIRTKIAIKGSTIEGAIAFCGDAGYALGVLAVLLLVRPELAAVAVPSAFLFGGAIGWCILRRVDTRAELASRESHAHQANVEAFRLFDVVRTAWADEAAQARCLASDAQYARAFNAARTVDARTEIAPQLWLVALVLVAAAGSADVVGLLLAVTFVAAARDIVINGLRLTALLDALERPEKPPAPLDGPAMDPAMPTGAIAAVDAGYQHHAANRWTLRGVSIEIPPGALVAVVGAPRTGKTTLARLLIGLLPPHEGHVAVGARDRRPRCAIVPQTPFVLSTSIHDNVALGCAAARRDEVMAWCTRTGAHARVVALPDGYDTPIVSEGMLPETLRHQLSLARALLAQPDVLVVDEALDALDGSARQACVDAVCDTRATRIVVSNTPEIRSRADIVVSVTADAIVTVERGAGVPLPA
jgi:ABC-type bacteriocin/lantibiotic exporter with double-glycine peptidase domain